MDELSSGHDKVAFVEYDWGTVVVEDDVPTELVIHRDQNGLRVTFAGRTDLRTIRAAISRHLRGDGIGQLHHDEADETFLARMVAHINRRRVAADADVFAGFERAFCADMQRLLDLAMHADTEKSEWAKWWRSYSP